MVDEALMRELDEYIDANWDQVVQDITALVRIESVEDMAHGTEGAPYGPGPKKALDTALDICRGYGFDAHDCEGYVGYADWKGASDIQVGIIGHLDVVPLGSGWSVDPLDVTRRDGYLMGRGTSDDKGPLMASIHAARFWKQRGVEFPYTLRFILGANEETGLRDVKYYRSRFADPAVLFTPDVAFPVCYGEKGGYDATFTSAPIPDGMIVDFEGGLAVNAVPGTARVVVRADASNLPAADRIAISQEGGNAVIQAAGVQSHAAYPQGGLSAIHLAARYVLDNGLCTQAEGEWLRFLEKLVSASDGSGVGLQSCAGGFDALTMVGGMIRKVGDRFVQTIDIRFTPATSPEQIEHVLRTAAEEADVGFACDLCRPVFLMDRDSPFVQALLSSYRDITGDMQEPFTLGGATYAREFTTAAGFGADVFGSERPKGIGAMHAVDEGMSEEMLKNAFKVYALAIGRLMELDL
jgi:succinyl-diaminopimelate desuccinylase